MGQKTNANIFRLGIKNNEWNSRYFEKNKEEFSLYNYQNIQIQNYITHFLNQYNLILHDCKFYLNGNNLYLYVSYYNNKKKENFKINNIKLKNKQQQENFLNNKKSIKKIKLSNFYINDNKQTTRNNFKLKTKRLLILKKYKNYSYKNKYSSIELLKKNQFLEQLLENLSLFTKKKFHIILTLQNINKGISLSIPKNEQEFLKKKLLFLKRYSKDKFFNESLNICLIVTKVKNSAKLFTNFLANQFTTLKRHNHFLIFLKRILTILINSKFSKIEGIKISINGRFNGAPRAKSRLISIGNIPIQTINKQINYYQTTSYTKNGTFGIKTWIN